MKKKTTKLMGIGLAFVLVASLMVFAIPTSAGLYEEPVDPTYSNLWTEFEPTPGADDGWFFDPNIENVGPIAENSDGTILYAYVGFKSGTTLADVDPANPNGDILTSRDGGHTWSTSPFPNNPMFYVSQAMSGRYNHSMYGSRVVDMVCSSEYPDVMYLTDGNYVFKTIDGGVSFSYVAAANLETHLMGNCGPAYTISCNPITSIDVGYDAAGKPIVFIGTKYVGVYDPILEREIVGSVYWIADESFAGSWHDLELECWGGCCNPTEYMEEGCYDVFSVGVAPGFDASNKAYATISAPLTGIMFLPSTPATVTLMAGPGCEGDDGVCFCWDTDLFMAGVTGLTAYVGGSVYDWSLDDNCLCLAPDETMTLVYDGSDADGGFMEIDYSGSGNGSLSWKLETAPGTAMFCGGTYVVSTVGTTCQWSYVSELKWDCLWSFSIHHASRTVFPSYYSTTPVVFVGVTAGPYFGWDCLNEVHHGHGGDVYRAADAYPPVGCIDLNVQGFYSGCLGKYDADIWSLDINDTDALIAGAYSYYEMQTPTTVYNSADGGWTWTASITHPTGGMTCYEIDSMGVYAGWEGLTEVLWSNELILAGTSGCGCGLSQSCGALTGGFFDQISLISDDIDEVIDMDHQDEYLSGASPLFLITRYDGYWDGGECYCPGAFSVYRYDQTYWERVYYSWMFYYPEPDPCYGCFVPFPTYGLDWVDVSPDAATTSCVYLFNTMFEGLRTLDFGCSWMPLTYECAPIPITAIEVIDLETVLAAGAPVVYRTTYHGAQPWDKAYPMHPDGSFVTDPIVDFDLSPDGNSVLFGTAAGEVFFNNMILSPMWGYGWAEIEDGVNYDELDAENTYVIFDPGYGTAGDPGENMVYAAAGTDIWRCDIDATYPMDEQDFVLIYDELGEATGIAAEGDTALYVSDKGTGGAEILRQVTVSGRISAEWTGQDWYAYEWIDYFEALQLPLVGTIDLIDREVTSEQGEFNDDEVVVHISDVLTTTGFNRYWAVGFENMDMGSASTTDWVGTGDGIETEFSGTLFYEPADPFTVYVYDNNGDETFWDMYGDGTLWSNVTGLQAGTVDYATGEFEVTFTIPPEVGEDVWADYDYPDVFWLFSTGNGLSGKIFTTGADVDVRCGIMDWIAFEFTPDASAGTYNPVTGYFELAPYDGGPLQPMIFFSGTGYLGFAYIFIPWNYMYGLSWMYMDVGVDSYFFPEGFPFPAATGTIGVKGSYSGATGEITLMEDTVWLPPSVWETVLDNWDVWTLDTFLEWWLMGVVREVNSTNLVTAVTPGSTLEDVQPTGVVRSLNPMDPMPPVSSIPWVVFERLTKGLETNSVLQHGAIPTPWTDDLWLTTGSNVLWVLDSGNPTWFWMWDDPLATPVIQTGPADGSQELFTDTVSLSWTALDKATEYEIWIYSYCPACPDNMDLMAPIYSDPLYDCVNGSCCKTITGLDPGTTYYWMVRVAEGEPFLSKWSDLRSFDTAMGTVPYLCSPYCGAEDVILTPNFSWDEVFGATAYDIEVATDEDFTALVASDTVSVNAWVTDLTLDYSSTYYWRVRAIKDGVAGAWAVCIFTTMSEPAEPPEPVEPVVIPPVEEITPLWIWVIIGIGAALVIAVIVLIVTTRRVS